MPNMSSTIERTAIALAKAALNSAALNGQQQSAPEKPPSRHDKPRLSTGKAMLVGAGLMAAGQVLVKTRGRDALNSARHGLAERIDGGGGDDEASSDEDFDDEYEDEPKDEADNDYDEQEPEDLEDEEYDDAPEDLEDEDYDDAPEDLEDDEDEHDEDEKEQTARRPRRKAAR